MRRLVWVLVILVSACMWRQGENGGPTRSVITKDRRTADYFETDAGTWDIFTSEGDKALFQQDDGGLEAAVIADAGYLWSLNHTPHTDIIVSATVEQTQGAFGTALGLICRADAAGNGYYFLIASDGQYSIALGKPGNNTLDDLVPWTSTGAIHTGYRKNTIRAVCAEDYLALFINDVFVAEAFDDTYTEGELGVALGAVEQTAWARFDDIIIQDAQMVGSR